MSNVSSGEVMKKFDLCRQYDVIKPWLEENGYTIKDLPLTATTEDGEDVIIENGGIDPDDNSVIYKLTYLQSNGWARVHMLHRDGTVEETYHR